MSSPQRLRNYPHLKKFILWALIPKNQARPRWWVRYVVNPFIHSKGKHSLIRKRVRLDVLPFNNFSLGNDSTIEDFATINNGLGFVYIGNRTRIGIGSVLIGPVKIGDDISIEQMVIISGLTRGYKDVTLPVNQQPIETRIVTIDSESWIGANSVILPGVTIGFHAIVAAGSVVTRNVPPFTLVAGNPALPKKVYEPSTNQWINVR